VNIERQHLHFAPIAVLVGATNVLQAATEKLLDVKDRMEVAGFHRRMDNQAREAHHLTMQDLREVQRVSLLVHLYILQTSHEILYAHN